MTITLPKVLAILGPTASGKTGLALALSEHFSIEIISLDSALVYRDMNIGTAKPTQAERAAVPHHLIDIISPLACYSAADFVNDCVQLVADIHARGRWPVIVGGTMMYYHALTQGLNHLPSADEKTRQRITLEKQQYGLAYLYAQLQAADAVTAARLNPNDSQRIERALEIFYLTNKPLSRHVAEQRLSKPLLDVFSIALIPADRARLHQAIALRFQQMLAHGFVDEVRCLRQQYPELQPDMPSMRCVGYRQVWDYLEGHVDSATFGECAMAATRQLAKRQLTWLRKLGADVVIDPYQLTQSQVLAQTEAVCRCVFAGE